MLSVSFYNVNLFKTENRDMIENFFLNTSIRCIQQSTKSLRLYVLFTNQKSTTDLFFAKQKVIIQIRHYSVLAIGRKRCKILADFTKFLLFDIACIFKANEFMSDKRFLHGFHIQKRRKQIDISII